MELILKVTDTTTDAISVLDEVAKLIEESKKKNEALVKKGRTKIDLVGECCHVEISIKENKQISSLANA